MQTITPARVPAFARRLVLGGAVAAAVALAAMQPAAPPAPASMPALVADALAADTATAPAPSPPAAAQDAGKTPPGANADGDASAAEGDSATSKGDHGGIVIEQGRKKIRIEGLGLGPDRQYDSFAQFMHDAPWLAGMFFIAMMSVFLVPLLIVALLVWYKLRKNRLANETMLKLAERGVVPPATAMDAVASGRAPAVAAAVEPTSDPAYNHARALHRRAVWSDLRKGVILSAIGVGLNLWSMLDDATPNGVGLILLFLGLGYCVLWFFEDRRDEPRGTP